MTSSNERKEKKLVPRFRRKNDTKNLIDADDQEAQDLIKKDLESHFKWTTDTIQHSSYQLDNFIDQQQQNNNQQQLSLADDHQNQFLYDIENNNNNDSVNINVEDNENHFIQWTIDQHEQTVCLSIDNNQQKQQRWTLNDFNQQTIQLNIDDKDYHHLRFDTDNQQQQEQQLSIKGEDFLQQMKFSTDLTNAEVNLCPIDKEDLKSISIDSTLPSINLILSLPQSSVNLKWLEGIYEYKSSLDATESNPNYSPLIESKFEIDSKNLKCLKWSLDLLKENLVYSYLISFPSSEKQEYSYPEMFHFKLSIVEQDNQFYSLIDYSFKQTLSITTNDLKEQILSIIDLIHLKQNFGSDEQFQFNQWSLNQIKNLILNLSIEDFLDLIYSPNDVKPIELENLLIQSDEGTAKAFRKSRCKHMSIKTDDKYQLEPEQGFKLEFKGNELIAIGEEQIQNDFDQEQTFKGITDNHILLEDPYSQFYDLTTDHRPMLNSGPCLYRDDYQCQPPNTSSYFRKEIGSISFDASLEEPIYYLNKSFKRYLHLPMNKEKCSFNVYNGYPEFIEKLQLNPTNYFRSFDSTDLRHLLYWYKQKQYLFSIEDKTLLKPPTFICRRTVLRTILANLYSDSDPWKLLVTRIKGQYYLALANKATKKVEEMTQDEYSGYKFEQLFTTDQPNTTRFKENIPLEKVQQQFHTVQYWQFGDFNILYSNEIDAEVISHMQPKTDTKQEIKQELDSTNVTSIQKEEEKPIELDWWEGGIPKVEISNEEIKEEKEETKDEAKKMNEFELKSGYIEMKCTNKKIFYRDENRLKTLQWWGQMLLANINQIMIGYKTTNDGIVDQIDLFSMEQFISKFYSKYNLHLRYCFSYLHSFLQLIQKTVIIDDPNTIHAFAYIPQPLEIDTTTGQILQTDLPNCVPFRYTQIQRSKQRHSNFLPQWYLEHIQRTQSESQSSKTIEQEIKKRPGHRGRNNFKLKLKQNKLKTIN